MVVRVRTPDCIDRYLKQKYGRTMQWVNSLPNCYAATKKEKKRKKPRTPLPPAPPVATSIPGRIG